MAHPKRSGPRRPKGNPVGKLSMTRKGYGFVGTSEGDFFISGRDIGGAMHGDIVEVRPDVHRTGKGRSGTVGRIVERAHQTLVGRYERSGSIGIVVPNDSRIMHDVFVSARDTEAVTGDMVVVRLTAYPSRNQSAQGYVEEVIGRADDPTIGVDVIIREHGLATAFPPGALEEAEKATLDVEAALREHDRIDLRDRFTFTVDPEDAKDFDDAITVDRIDGRLRLGVHIADVSHYVPWNSDIDVEARRRATSVYLVDRVLPMLPEELSNGLCSLNPGEDRLAFTVDMWLTKDGAVEDYRIFPSVIRSDMRLDYDTALRMLNGEIEYPSKEIGLALQDFANAAAKTAARKQARGGLDFETVEAKVKLDENGVPLEVILRERTQSTSMIEEAMILANETVAKHMTEAEAPMVYRIHEAPDSDALSALAPILKEFDYPVKDLTGVTPAMFQKIIKYAHNRPEKYLINSLVLRAMERARYTSRYDTHFGLASKAYTHFTSPIRRYPDLMVHRLLRAQLNDELETDPRVAGMIPELEWLCEHSSEMEREAERASYDSTMLKLCEYMNEHIGEEFSGFVTGVLAYGMFVRLANTAEGLVHIDSMGDRYSYDPVRHMLLGEETGRHYRLGQQVDVRVESVTVSERRIDFKLV